MEIKMGRNRPVFIDENAAIPNDPDHSIHEGQFVLIGFSSFGVCQAYLLMNIVWHTSSMPGLLRIQYWQYFYHVMNRGREHQHIFHGKAYYQAFLKTLDESHCRFDAVVHAYSCMSNHYHLLIETSRANLDRITHHVNEVYTQEYNRLKRSKNRHC